MKKSKIFRAVVFIVATAAAALSHYIMLPAFNFADPALMGWIVLVALFYAAAIFISSSIKLISGARFSVRGFARENRATAIAVGIALLFMVLPGVLSLAQAPFFRSGTYKDLIEMKEGDFAADVAELSMTQIPVVDKNTASELGRRKLGEINELVSQFEISDDYVQINYKDKPVRVTPLIYADFFKWLNNRSDGLPAYILVDMVTQEAHLQNLDKNMRYSPSEYFGRDLRRHVRYAYPTAVFDEFTFEIDDNGNPYWIIPVIKYRVFPWGGKDIKGVILVDPSDGSSDYYDVEDAPQWIDRVYNANIIVEQLTWNGMYRTGFFNAYIGQRGVIQPTDGYNYIAVNDDVYLYTGMTSIVSDESNIGFVLVNMRTKETMFYQKAGAEEYSAMNSAEGQVQHLGYQSTFPILLNIGDRPTYFVSLKDAAGLVKLFGFVDYERYQIVATGTTVSEAMSNYISILRREAQVEVKKSDKEATVFDISQAVVDGNTIYYIVFENDPAVYTAGISISPVLPFVRAGTVIYIEYSENKNINEITYAEIR